MNRLVVFLLALVPLQSVWAQEAGTIVGTVTDLTIGGPVAAARVTVSGTRYSATTGGDGRYTIGQVPPGTYVVRAQVIGYAVGQQANVVVRGGDTVVVSFQLQPQAVELNPVVAVGYGTQAKATLTGAVSAVAGEAIQGVPNANVSTRWAAGCRV